MSETSESLSAGPGEVRRCAEAAAVVIFAAAVVFVPLVFSTNTPYALDIKRPISGTCALLAGLALLVRWAAGGRIPDAARGVVRAAGLFILATVVSLAFARHTETGLRETWLLGSHVLMFIAAAIVFRRREWAERFVFVLLVIAAFEAVCGCLQAAGIEFAPLSWSKGDREILLGQGGRVFGTIGLETALGGYMAACAVLALGAIFHFKDAAGRIALAAGALLMVLCMILTGTRTAWFACAVGCVVGCVVLIGGLRASTVMKVLRSWAGAAVLAVLLAGATCLAVFLGPAVCRRVRKIPEHLSTRTTIWKSAIGMFEAHPVVGVGPGAFTLNFPEYRPADYADHRVTSIALHAHSEYLDVLAETGMLGFVSFAVLIGLVAIGSVRALKRSSGEGRMLLNAAFAAAMTMLVHAVASVDTRYPTCQLLLWVLMGLAAARWQDASADEPAAPRQASMWRKAVAVAGIGVAIAIWTTQVYYPHRARVLLDKAETRQGTGEWAESVAAASRALELDPTSAPSYYALANSLFYGGEYDAALRVFRELQVHAPAYADTHVRIGVLNALLGRMDEARSALRLARRYGVATRALAAADDLSDDELRKRALDYEKKDRPH